MGGIKQPVFKFQAFSKKQKQVLTWWLSSSPMCHSDGIIADGSIRSGKTLSMSLSFVLWAMQTFSRQNFAMCGKTIGSFRRNVLFWLRLMLISMGYSVRDHRADNLLEVSRNGTVNYFYLFGGKDERSQDLIQGITLAGVLFDEVALMPQSFVNQATGRCSVSGSKLWFNCNPEGPQHWFKTEWIDKAKEKSLICLHFTMDDNLSLSEETKARYRSYYTGIFFERYILGLWAVAEGVIYSMFDKSRHVTSEQPNGDEYYISIDYGTLNPCSMGLWSVDLRSQRATRIREYYYDGRKTGKCKTDSEYYGELVALAKGFDIFSVVIDPSAASFITEIRNHNRFDVRRANNDVIEGIRRTATYIQTGKLIVHESCTGFLKEIFLYRWDDKSSQDKVLKENDHAMDDTRYFCNTILRQMGW